ncbi:hypothetical protein PVAP13_6NG259600 [Panicum virgatum]|uniref:Uncharacterized protein n=1 Tax=Panicum virgatum TaxID=38727 RepID=A0A8T0R435_PANVG|nr:hypothetical protein PVAP13_6NG259600 [Panicum virgatum]
MSWIRELLHQAVLQVLHGVGSMSDLEAFLLLPATRRRRVRSYTRRRSPSARARRRSQSERT